MSDITLWSKTANNNNASPPNGFPEGMAPSTVNDACREVMASVRKFVEDGGWFNWGHTYTYVSGTSFSVPTDLTATYHTGRRVRAVGSSTGTIYGVIASSAYGSVTAVVVTWDSGSLSNETLVISLGYLSATGPAFSGVGLIGDQTIAGIKTFTSFPVTPSAVPTTDYQVANRKYATDLIPIGVTSFKAHEQTSPGMTVRVDAGILFVGGSVVSVALQNTSAISAPSAGTTRIDRIVINALTGVISVLTETPATSPATPTAPAISVGYFPNCQIALDESTLAITNSLITDERVIGGGSLESIRVNGFYTNLGADPATELGYGTWILSGFISSSPISYYPPVQNDTYVKATETQSANYYPYFATNPAKPLTGAASGNSWQSINPTDNRFHIDLGIGRIITSIYYENWHDSGADLTADAKAFTVWGAPDTANGATAFATLTYGTDTYWTQLPADITQFVQHTAVDQADPHHIVITNTIAYRYYAIKIAGCWSGSYIALRRIVLQVCPALWLRTA